MVLGRAYNLIIVAFWMGHLYKYSDKKVRMRLCSDFAKDGASKGILTFFTKLY